MLFYAVPRSCIFLNFYVICCKALRIVNCLFYTNIRYDTIRNKYIGKSFAPDIGLTMPAPHHSILQAGCSSWRPTNSFKALKATFWQDSVVSATPVLPSETVFRLIFMTLLTLIRSNNISTVYFLIAYQRLLYSAPRRCIQRRPANFILKLNLNLKTADCLATLMTCELF